MTSMVESQPKIKFVNKGWGFEEWIVNKELYCGKKLFFFKGKRCSLHYHLKKDEVFYIQSGKLLVHYHDPVGSICRDNLHLWMKKSVEWNYNPVYGIFENKSKSEHDPFGFSLKTITLSKGDNFYVPPGRIHQMVALEETELFEFSTQHFDEDSLRIVKGD